MLMVVTSLLHEGRLNHVPQVLAFTPGRDHTACPPYGLSRIAVSPATVSGSMTGAAAGRRRPRRVDNGAHAQRPPPHARASDPGDSQKLLALA
jgi:hypothetical protein